jgi:hypothetical protein
MPSFCYKTCDRVFEQILQDMPRRTLPGHVPTMRHLKQLWRHDNWQAEKPRT